MKPRESKSKGMHKKKMKLKDLVNTKAMRNDTRRVKHPKFGEIDVNFQTSKRNKSFLNFSKHQSSEYIEVVHPDATVQNKGKVFVALTWAI